MLDALRASASLVDASGYAIITLIVLLTMSAGFATALLRVRYARIQAELAEPRDPEAVFASHLLARVVRDVRAAHGRQREGIEVQALIEHALHAECAGSLVAERFIKASSGLAIVLGLVGTFYGLTLSIGKLAALMSGDAASVTAATESLTRGLTEALTGMSVAFSTSLVGILSAIGLTLLGVFYGVADRRNALLVQIETFVQNRLLPSWRAASAAPGMEHAGDQSVGQNQSLAPMLARFEHSVAQLHGTVEQFQTALNAFAVSTRDFREFNHHLKDNVQRMSLSFADFSEALKSQTRSLRARD